MVMSIFRGGGYDRCGQATVDMIEKKLHILQQGCSMQGGQIQGRFVLINMARVEWVIMGGCCTHWI